MRRGGEGDTNVDKQDGRGRRGWGGEYEGGRRDGKENKRHGKKITTEYNSDRNDTQYCLFIDICQCNQDNKLNSAGQEKGVHTVEVL